MKFDERKKLILSAFDTVADSYDNPALRFFVDSATCLSDLLALSGTERLLDVASGTGAVALSVAASLPRGHVTGIDFSEGMLTRAREKAKATGLGNVEFIQMDVERLDLPADSFDAASCAFGIFFLEDMAEAMREIAGKVKPGGRIVISTFSESSFSPLADIFLDRIRSYGVEVPSLLSWKRLARKESLFKLLDGAGLKKIRIHEEELGYFLKDADQWWQFLWGSGFRGLINKLSKKDLDKFRAEHKAEIMRHAAKQGIKLRVDCLYGVGTR